MYGKFMCMETQWTNTIFLDTNLYGEFYYEMLNDQINSLIIDELENHNNAQEAQASDITLLHCQ